MKTGFMVRFRRGKNRNIVSREYGPFSTVVLRDGELRVDDAVVFADTSPSTGKWRLFDPFDRIKPQSLSHVSPEPTDMEPSWDIVTVYTEGENL